MGYVADMMKFGVFVAAVTTLAAACSSSTEDVSECVLAGRYTMTGQILSATPGCSVFGSSTPQVTLTVSPVSDGSYVVSFDTLIGTCSLMKTSACSTRAVCDVSTPGKLDFAWTFGANGFTGTNVAALSASTAIPNGCNYTAASTGAKL